jgi:16S rRNA (cytosine1402-N4)-methyltransferase
MSAGGYSHRPVLFDEVNDAMQVRADGIYVDATFGRGGHADALLARLGEQGRLIVMDKDPDAIACARERLSADARVTIIHDDYARLAQHIAALDLNECIDGVLVDLGVSSPQLDDASRGFSFQHNGPLDMRMNKQQGMTAADWLAQADEREIAEVLWRYGEERHSRRIARRVVEFRQQRPISDTATLVALINECVPRGKDKKHPATRSFQAIRIKVNDELEHLGGFLAGIFDVLRMGGRLLVISFHSLEDRMVKRFIRKHANPPELPRGLPLLQSDIQAGIRLKAIGKALRASTDEIHVNPRARSAVLRIAERIG